MFQRFGFSIHGFFYNSVHNSCTYLPCPQAYITSKSLLFYLITKKAVFYFFPIQNVQKYIIFL